LQAAGADIHLGRPLEELMRGVSLYVGTAGLTLLEACAAGLPAVVCAVAPNQRLNIRAARQLGIPAFPAFEPGAMAREAAALLAQGVHPPLVAIDGEGARRVTAAILAQVEEHKGVSRRTA
jgi:hypothetical protein